MASGEIIRCIQVGLGPIGCGIVRLIQERQCLELVGAVDVSPAKIGRDVGEIVALGQPTGVIVSESVRECPEADVVLQSTSSHLSQIAEQLKEFIGLGLNCISTAEEMTWPWLREPELADELNKLATAKGVRLIGAGVNPGFAMDLLPTLLTAPCQRVHRILARRVVDTLIRRPQLQKKTGLGITEAEYRALAQKGAVGHVGLRESAAVVAASLSWVPEAITEVTEPVLAEESLHFGSLSLSEGQVRGSRQVAEVIVDGESRVRLELDMYAGAPDPRDEIEIAGVPSFTVHIPSGIAGDEATPACVVNLIRPLLRSPIGLLTIKDMIAPHYVG